MAGFWQSRSATSKIYTKGWTNDQYCDRNALRRCRTGDTFSAGKDLARAHATTPDRGVAHEERLQARRGPPFQSSRRLGRCRLSGNGSRAEQNAVLHVGGLWSGECRHLDSHPYEHGDPPAHGAVGLPAGSAAGLPGRQARVAAVLRDSGAGLGADRLKLFGTSRSWRHALEVADGRAETRQIIPRRSQPGGWGDEAIMHRDRDALRRNWHDEC